MEKNMNLNQIQKIKKFHVKVSRIDFISGAFCKIHSFGKNSSPTCMLLITKFVKGILNDDNQMRLFSSLFAAVILKVMSFISQDFITPT